MASCPLPPPAMRRSMMTTVLSDKFNVLSQLKLGRQEVIRLCVRLCHLARREHNDSIDRRGLSSRLGLPPRMQGRRAFEQNTVCCGTLLMTAHRVASRDADTS